MRVLSILQDATFIQDVYPNLSRLFSRHHYIPVKWSICSQLQRIQLVSVLSSVQFLLLNILLGIIPWIPSRHFLAFFLMRFAMQLAAKRDFPCNATHRTDFDMCRNVEVKARGDGTFLYNSGQLYGGGLSQYAFRAICYSLGHTRKLWSNRFNIN